MHFYDVIDFIAIYNVLEMALSSMLYIHVVNDVIMCSRQNIFSRYLHVFLKINFIY